MERCAELIEKLQLDFKNNASAEQLLLTIQILQKELQLKVTSPSLKRSGKVSIVMPNSFQTNIFDNTESTKEKGIEINIIKEPLPETENQLVEPEAIPSAVESFSENEVEQSSTFIFEELPTVAHNEKVNYELNDKVANEKPELNEQLVTNKTEVADIHLDAPIKDLKKGITLNDKFVFISELFRGDESMYDRSIKTINNFQIYPEAQFWMERELKTKIGWDDNNDTVQHFYDLVKRRFAST